MTVGKIVQCGSLLKKGRFVQFCKKIVKNAFFSVFFKITTLSIFKELYENKRSLTDELTESTSSYSNLNDEMCSLWNSVYARFDLYINPSPPNLHCYVASHKEAKETHV